MAFFDWNRNGKIDIQAAFLEYNIFKACTEEKDDNLFSLDEEDNFFDDTDDE